MFIRIQNMFIIRRIVESWCVSKMVIARWTDLQLKHLTSMYGRKYYKSKCVTAVKAVEVVRLTFFVQHYETILAATRF